MATGRMSGEEASASGCVVVGLLLSPTLPLCPSSFEDAWPWQSAGVEAPVTAPRQLRLFAGKLNAVGSLIRWRMSASAPPFPLDGLLGVSLVPLPPLACGSGRTSKLERVPLAYGVPATSLAHH